MWPCNNKKISYNIDILGKIWYNAILMELIPTHSRRTFLVAAAGGLLVGCSKPETPITPQNIATPPTQTGPISPTERLVRVINELPTSPIKVLLDANVANLFSKKPTAIRHGNTAPIPIYEPRVNHAVNPNTGYNGNYSVNSPATSKTYNTFQIDKDVETFMVLTDLLKPEEATTFAQTSDGLPYQKLSIPANFQVLEGLYPEINISTPRIPSAQIDPFERYIYGKEAASILAYMLLIQSIVTNAEKTGLSVDTQVGEKMHNLIPHMINRFERGSGRFQASLDLAGYVIALKAFEGTSVLENIVRSDPNYRDIVGKVLVTNFGSTPLTILRASLNLAINEPTTQKLRHAGDINKISDLKIDR